MQKIRDLTNGITLIALVVTIVVLLILAGVTIVTLFGQNGIITAAQRAKEKTESGVTNELAILDEIGDIDRYLNGNKNETKWEEVKNEKGQVIAVKSGEQTLEIGDYVLYDCKSGEGANATYTSYSYGNRDKNNGITSGCGMDQVFNSKKYDGTWRVIGTNKNGELLIMAASNIKGDTYDKFCLGRDNGTNYEEQGKLAYQYAVQELNNISAIYGKGNGATGARSITVDDINKITGYDAAKSGDIEITGYGKSATLYWDGTHYPYYECMLEGEKQTGKLGTIHISFTWWENGEWKTSEKPTDLTSQVTEVSQMKKINETPIVGTYYWYYPETLTTKNTDKKIGIEADGKIYKMLFGKSGSENYYLGTAYITTPSYYEHFGLQAVSDGHIIRQNVIPSRGLWWHS